MEDTTPTTPQVSAYRRASSYEALYEQLYILRKDQGTAGALSIMMTQPLHHWIEWLEGSAQTADPAMVAELTIGMTQVLAVRDVLIMSMIVPRGHWDEALLARCMTHARSPENTKRMTRLLTQSFDSTSGPDQKLFYRALAFIRTMIQSAPEEFRVQPYALLAYALWWRGEGEAVTYARKALALDARCSLAVILMRAMTYGIGPASVGKPIVISPA